MIGPAVLAGILGACVGSFSATVALRWGAGESALRGGSRCDHCTRPLSPLHTIPVASYLWLRGKCSGCRAVIHPAHPIAEVLVAGAAGAAVLMVGGISAGLIGVLAALLTTTAIIDIRTRTLPDALTIAIATTCGGLALCHGWRALVVGLAASGLTCVILQAAKWALGRTTGRPVLGGGDVKLLAALAIWTGVATPWAIVGAAVTGLILMGLLRPSDGRLSFGPAIGLAFMVLGLGREGGLWSQVVS